VRRLVGLAMAQPSTEREGKVVASGDDGEQDGLWITDVSDLGGTRARRRP